ncbi:MAG: DUF1844 domain-containing protein [Myxococcota bacterium]
MSGAESEGGHDLPKVDFSTFVLSLATAALYQLGVVPDPASGAPGVADPLVARQTLETLEMLREKTQGNLTEDERKLIDSLLCDLRLRYVELTR